MDLGWVVQEHFHYLGVNSTGLNDNAKTDLHVTPV
jgi:hypothetical protein